MKMIIGETRRLIFETGNRKGETYTISSAVYSLLRDGTTQVQTGTCEVDGHRLSFYCTPSEVCSYIVQITWVVGIERRIARFWLEVTA